MGFLFYVLIIVRCKEVFRNIILGKIRIRKLREEIILILYILLIFFVGLLLTTVPGIAYVQYTSLFAIGLFLSIMVPAIVGGIKGKRIKNYGWLISLYTSCLMMLPKLYQFWQFIVFMLFELFLVKWYSKHKRFYRLIFALSILPLVLTKISERLSLLFGGYSFIGFIGISYVSFRVWQILFDIHDNNLKNPSFSDMLYFITFFPTLSSGPIDRYKRFCDDMYKQISRTEYIHNYLIPGTKKILRAIAYKFAISAVIKVFVLDKIPSDVTVTNALIYMYAYTLFLFFDFAGYSNFAIGTSYFLGINTPKNFDKPFLAHNMKEFWERWHISLSKWFGDYIFSRLVLNFIRSNKLKSRKVAVRVGYMLTMTLMGLWHGFYFFYIVYGIYQGLMLVFTDIYIKSKIFKRFKKSKYYNIVSRVVCFHIIAFGMLIFSGYLFKI